MQTVSKQWQPRLIVLDALYHLPAGCSQLQLQEVCVDAQLLDWFSFTQALQEAQRLGLIYREDGLVLSANGLSALQELGNTLPPVARTLIAQRCERALLGRLPTWGRAAHYVPRSRGYLCRCGQYTAGQMQWFEEYVTQVEAARDICQRWVAERH